LLVSSNLPDGKSRRPRQPFHFLNCSVISFGDIASAVRLEPVWRVCEEFLVYMQRFVPGGTGDDVISGMINEWRVHRYDIELSVFLHRREHVGLPSFDNVR